MKNNVFWAILAVVALASVFTAGCFYKSSRSTPVKPEVERYVDGLYDRFEDQLLKVDDLKADTTRVYESQMSIYILKTYAIHDAAYQYAKQEDLLHKDKEQFNRTATLMQAIYNAQLMEYRTMNPLISGVSLSQLFVIEAEQFKRLVDDLTTDACIDVLKIDPTNQDAKRVLNQIYGK